MQETANEVGGAQVTLRQATDLLRYFDPATAGMWPRAVALLARQALESGVREFWLSKSPAVAGCSTRAQLLSLTEYVEKETAERARQTWAVLSRACHHHPYELAPTSAELDLWTSEVSFLIGALQASQTPSQ